MIHCLNALFYFMIFSTNFHLSYSDHIELSFFIHQKAHHKIDCVHAHAIHSQFYDGLITKQFILLAIHLITYNKNKKQDILAIIHYPISMIFFYIFIIILLMSHLNSKLKVRIQRLFLNKRSRITIYLKNVSPNIFDDDLLLIMNILLILIKT
jgi:hypothetical protein